MSMISIRAFAATVGLAAMLVSLDVFANDRNGQQNPADEVAAAMLDAWYAGDAVTVRKRLDELESLVGQATDKIAECRIHVLAGLGWRDYSALVPETVVALKAAIPHLEKAIALEPNHAEAHALLANICRRLVGAGDRDAETIHKAMEHRETAYRLAPENPLVLLYEASAFISIPEDRGGDIRQGIAAGFEAIGRFRFENRPEAKRSEAETWAVIGSGYRKLEQNDLALRAYKNALQVEPRWKAIREKVIPGLENPGQAVR